MVAVETPYPTTAEYLAMANVVTGRPSLALKEIERRLSETLLEGSARDLIGPFNTQQGYATDDVKIRYPKAIAGAPVVDEANGYVNCITMALSETTEIEGNREYKNIYSLSIYSIDTRIEAKEQYGRNWERRDVIAIALHPFLGGCVNPAGKVCWSSMIRTQSGFEPEDWEQYAGMYLFYNIVCGPAQNAYP